MRLYELVVVLKTSLSETQRKKLVETIKSWLGKANVVKEDSWGQKVFAYPIKKEESGFYYVFSVESETGLPTDLEKKILANDTVLRHLLVRKK